MRLKAISLIVAISIALPITAQAYNESKYTAGDCRPGGDGPKPLLTLPSFLPHIHPFPMPDGIVDGLFLPKTSRFALRDQSGNFSVANFKTHSLEQLTRFDKPIARVRDASERYFSPEGKPVVFDTTKRQWMSYRPAYNGHMRPLFWRGNELFSAVTSSENEDGRNASFRLQKWVAGAARATKVCRLANFFLDAGYKLGEGHSYPYMVLHRTERKTATGRQLTVTFLDVENCQSLTKVYGDLMKGEVLNVHYFAKMKSVLIQVDHPMQQLVWDTGPDDAHCHYYSLANSKLVIVGYDHPIIGAYDPYDGLSLVYMHDEHNNPPKTAQVTGEYPLADVGQYDLELSPDKMSLIGVTQLIDKSKTLVKIDLPTVN